MFVADDDSVRVYAVNGSVSQRLGPPRASAAVLTGVDTGRPRFRFRLRTVRDAAEIRSLAISPPAGLSFSHDRRRLAAGVLVGGLKHSLTLTRGRLHVTLSQPAAEILIRIASPALVESHALKDRAASLTAYDRIHRRRPKTARLTFGLITTDSLNTSVPESVVISLS